MEKIIFNSKLIKGFPGYEAKIADQNASVFDFMESLNQFIISGNLQRLWPENKSDCIGCDLCCHEPLPVTSVDINLICQAKNISLMDAYRYLWVQVDRKVVDITLKRGKNQRCIFLQDNGLCSIYVNRPFLCQTYVCTHTSDAIEALRSQIVNQGMDELIRSSILAFREAGQKLPVNQSNHPHIQLSDWPKNIYSGKKNYGELKLSQVLSSDLFAQMLL